MPRQAPQRPCAFVKKTHETYNRLPVGLDSLYNSYHYVALSDLRLPNVVRAVQEKKPYLTPGEVAELLMVTPMTIRRWVNQGDLLARTTAGGHRRFLKRDVVRFARERGLTLSPDEGDSLRVLIIDDNDAFARFLADALTALPNPVEIETANDGFGAGLRVRDFHPHVVLLDLMMPQVNGFDACREIKQDPSTSSVDVVALTGYYTEENARRAKECGASACLAKPVKFRSLLAALGLAYSDAELESAGLLDLDL